MEELIVKLWPYLDRAGAVAGLIMSIMWFLNWRELRDLRAQVEAKSVQLVTDGKASVAVIEKNTAAMHSQNALLQGQSDLIRDLLIMIAGNRNV